MSDDAVRDYLGKDEPEGVLGTLWFCVNPFRKVDGWTAMAWGAVVVSGTVLVAVFGHVHFDGVMDMHVGAGAKPEVFAAEAIIDWLTVALVFWAGAAIFVKSKPLPRGLDFFGMLGIGRLPFLLAGLLFVPSLLGGTIGDLTSVVMANLQHPDQLGHLILGVPGIGWFFAGLALSMVIMIWGLFLNFFAVREASGMETVGAEALFVGGTILSEIVSKLAILAIVLHWK